MVAAMIAARDRIRSQHQDAAGTEDGVGDERHDGGVQPIDGGQTGCLGVPHAHRHQHGGEHQSGDQVVAQPARLVAAQGN